MKNRRRLIDPAVPTIFLPILTSDSSKMVVNHTIEAPVLELHAHDLDANTSAKQVHNSTKQDPIPSTSQQCNPLQTPARKGTLRPDSPFTYKCPVKKRLCRRILELKNVVKEKNVALRKLRDSNRKLKRRIDSLQSLLD